LRSVLLIVLTVCHSLPVLDHCAHYALSNAAYKSRSQLCCHRLCYHYASI